MAMVRVFYSICFCCLSLIPRNSLFAGNEGYDIFQAGIKQYEGGHNEIAHQQFQEALHIAEKNNDQKLQASVLRSMGENYRAMGEFPLALEVLNKSRRISEGINDSLLMCHTYNRLSAVEFQFQHLDKAMIWAESSIQIARAIKDTTLISSNLDLLGAIARDQKNYAGCIGYLNEAAKLMRISKDTTHLANVYNNLSNTYLRQGQPDEAMKFAKYSLSLAKQFNISVYALYAYQLLISANEKKGDYRTALELKHAADNFRDSLNQDGKFRQIYEINAKYMVDQKDKENEKLIRENLEASTRTHRLWLLVIVISSVSILIIFSLVARSRAQKKIQEARALVQQTEEVIALNQEIEKNLKKLEVTNQMKDRLFSIIAHDVRSPLNSIQGILSLVKSGSLTPDELTSLSDSLIDRVVFTSALLENLLSWSHSQLDGFKVKRAKTDIALLCTLVLDQLGDAIEKKKIKLENHIPADTMVYADQDMIEIVLRNLVANAIKFTPANGTIRLECEITGDQLALRVIDSGIGIEPENLSRIFVGESFTTQGTAREKGSGLGLILCKDFIEKNHGKLSATSEPGKGSCFMFTLPLNEN